MDKSKVYQKSTSPQKRTVSRTRDQASRSPRRGNNPQNRRDQAQFSPRRNEDIQNRIDEMNYRKWLKELTLKEKCEHVADHAFGFAYPVAKVIFYIIFGFAIACAILVTVPILLCPVSIVLLIALLWYLKWMLGVMGIEIALYFLLLQNSVAWSTPVAAFWLISSLILGSMITFIVYKSQKNKKEEIQDGAMKRSKQRPSQSKIRSMISTFAKIWQDAKKRLS